jgi:hypothetical protein
MPFMIKGEDAVTPSSFSHDLSTNTNVNAQGKGPYMMALEMWCDTPDGAAGSWSLAVEYDDPTGNTVELGQGAFGPTVIPLSSLPAYKAIPLTPLSRLSNTSNWRIVATLIGSAGVSKVSWRVWAFPSSSFELLGF